MKLEWSWDAIADLDRFAVHLQAERPGLAATIASAIIEQAKALSVILNWAARWGVAAFIVNWRCVLKARFTYSNTVTMVLVL